MGFLKPDARDATRPSAVLITETRKVVTATAGFPTFPSADEKVGFGEGNEPEETGEEGDMGAVDENDGSRSTGTMFPAAR